MSPDPKVCWGSPRVLREVREGVLEACVYRRVGGWVCGCVRESDREGKVYGVHVCGKGGGHWTHKTSVRIDNLQKYINC